MRGLRALALSVIVLGCGYIVWDWYRSSPPRLTHLGGQVVDLSSSGNRTIANFDEAKLHASKIYRGMQVTFYCGCSFAGQLVDHKSCGYMPLQEDERAYRVEWEHVVPASAFGRKFSAWTQGDSRCVSSRGKPFRGRRCARLVSEKFRQMESDLYNLVPEIGEMNELRGALPYSKHLPRNSAVVGGCKTKIGRNAVQPREEIRGFIARTYRYMEVTYPGFDLISEEMEALFREWESAYPPTEEELVRGKRIAMEQGNTNPFLVAVPNTVQEVTLRAEP